MFFHYSLSTSVQLAKVPEEMVVVSVSTPAVDATVVGVISGATGICFKEYKNRYDYD